VLFFYVLRLKIGPPNYFNANKHTITHGRQCFGSGSAFILVGWIRLKLIKFNRNLAIFCFTWLKKYEKISIFFSVWCDKRPLDPIRIDFVIWIRIRIDLNCWIRIRLKTNADLKHWNILSLTHNTISGHFVQLSPYL
jgi:hypothetical protein